MNKCKEFGNLYRKYRLELDKGIKEYCNEYKIDPVFLCKLEYGRINFFDYSKSRKNKPLINHMKYLELEEDDKRKFLDCFRECNGEQVEEFTEEDVLKNAPLFVTSKDGEKLNSEELDLIVSLLKNYY